VGEGEQRPTTRRWIFLGLAIAIPLGAVALYFAVLAPPPPPAPVAAAPRGAAPAGLPADHPPIGGAAAGAQDGERAHPQMGSTGRAVRVPDAVKGKWRAVKAKVETKGGGSPPQTITLSLGAEVVVPGTTLKLRAEEFLPALQVKDNEITSGSNEPANPAVLMTISEDGKQVFHGWLFSKFPDMQPFEHPKYRITLIEGVPAG
jgi:hypothetical protein